VAAILTGMVTPSTPVPPPRREGRRFIIPTPADLRHPRQRSTVAEEESAAEPVAGPVADETSEVAGASQATDRTGENPAQDETPEPATPGSVTAATPVPTPGTLPRPRSITPTGSPEPVQGEDASAARRPFPNPATLMAAGRGRKVRPHGLRARRLPKVEETSAGGVVLDLAADPPAVALIARHDRRSRLLWSLPKGHVEEGETPEVAALREVLEETGLEGRIIAPLGVIDFWFVVEDKRIHKTVHHYVIEAVGGELSDEDIEVEAVEWIPYDQVVRRLAYGDERRLVEKVAQIVPGVR
jgi:ADP-ribose pyrophosphatase YjhB (NUDIX family)